MVFWGASYKATVLVGKQAGLDSDFKVRNCRIFFMSNQYTNTYGRHDPS